MPHNLILELGERNEDYHTYVKKKHSFKDKIIMCILVPIMITNIIQNIVGGYWAAYDIILRVIGLVGYLLCVYFYKQVFKSDVNLWLYVTVLGYILLLENLTVAFGVNPLSGS